MSSSDGLVVLNGKSGTPPGLANMRRVILCAGTGCMANGAMKVFERFRAEIAGAGLNVVLELRQEAGDHDVRLSKSGCQGFCQMGPLVSVVPDGILFTKVRAEDVPEIVNQTLVGGQVVERLLYKDPATRKHCRGLEDNPFYARQNRRVLRECGFLDPEDIHEFMLHGGYTPLPVPHCEYSEMQVTDALHSVGKYSAADELNCGGCGYESCRDFARALIARNAERMMCATYTRKLAQKKANALLQKMPSGVVIVDEQLQIIECNGHFLRLFSEEVEQERELEGCALDAVIPFSNLFQRVLESGEDIVSHDIRYQRSILNTSIFTIEPHAVLCGIFQDITEPIFQKEQIIGRAKEVIQKNLKTVQQIAYLLGENAADSEIILNSIVRSFSPEDLKDGKAQRQK
jgi:(2Fe-2S) ferredoxin